MTNFTFFFIRTISITSLIIIIITIYARNKHNIKLSKVKKILMPVKHFEDRQVDEKTLKNEKDMMNYLNNGKIMCHTLQNSSSVYDVKKWIKEMDEFMQSSNYKYLMNMEGHDIDE